MIKVTLVAASALFAAGAASAQTVDTPSWTGPYVGIHGGYDFDDGSQISDTGNAANNVTAINTGVRPARMNQNRAGGLAGGQFGYNLQRGNLVLGAEGDYSYMRFGQDNDSIYTGTDGRVTRTVSRLDWMATARGRLGYSFGSGMFYGTGGYAVGRVRGNADFYALNGAVNYSGAHKYTAQGWTAGVGAEFRPFTQGPMSRVSFRLESNYYDLGRSHIEAGQTAAAAGFYTLGVATRGYNAKAGINYAF